MLLSPGISLVDMMQYQKQSQTYGFDSIIKLATTGSFFCSPVFNNKLPNIIFMIYIVSDIGNMSNKSLIPLQTFKSCLVCLQQNNPLANISVDELKMLEHIVDAKFTDQRLPNKACEGCLKELEFCSKFIEKCKYNYSTLLAALEEENGEINYSSDISDHKEFELNFEERNGNIKADRTEAAGIDQIFSCIISLVFTYWRKALFPVNIVGRRETPYKCKVCNKGFKSSTSCKKHENVHHFIVNDEESETDTQNKIAKNGIDNDVDPNADKVECEICKRKIHKLRYGVHRKSHLTEKKQYICTYCNKEFQKNSRLQQHLRIHTGDRPYVCEICSKSHIQAGNLKRHIMTHHHLGTKQFQCQHCGKFYSTKAGLESHVRTHSKTEKTEHTDPTKRRPIVSNTSKRLSNASNKEKKFLCMICGKTYTAKGTLKQHILHHTGETPHKCIICYKGFYSKTVLKYHMMKVHTDDKPYGCLICHKHFYDTRNLKRHMDRVHSIVDTVKNEDEEAADLKRHHIKHTGLKQFQCQHCGKQFCTRSGLAKHVDQHLDKPRIATVKSFLCMVCGKRFTASPSLKVHMRRHTGETPYQCQFCTKAFADKTSLKQHTRRYHTGEKPFTCMICDKMFYDSTNYKKHMKKEHNDGWMEHLKTHSFPRYECTICGINFKYAEALTKHLGTLSHKRSNKGQKNNKIIAEVGTAHMRKELDKEDPNLECAHCKEIFLSKNEWMEHLKTHSFPRYECTICGKNFKNADALTKHEGTVGHKNRKEQTETSSKNRKTFKDLFTQAKDSGKLKLTCTLCARLHHITGFHILAKSHFPVNIVGRRETPYKCKVCNKGFKSSTSCKKHENVHHFIVNDEESETDTQNKIAKNGIDDDVDPNADKVECEICKSKIHKHGYGGHRKSHLTEKKQYICTYCNKEFQKNSRLQRHLRIHTGDRPYVCEICSKSYIQAGDLKRHMTHHHLGTKQFQCEHCGKFYSTKAGLESHVRTHSKTEKTEHTDPTKRRPIVSNTSKRLSNASNKEKKFLCMICGKTYTAKGTLKQHILHHTGETPHKCIICYKGFYNKTVLKYHMMKVHTDDKPYGCLICHKHFYDTRNLKRHMDRVHSSVDTVNNEDEEAADLKRHHIKHTGLKQFQCQHCGRQFCTRSGLAKHVDQHLDKPRIATVKSFLCMVCGKRFTASPSLKVHMRRHTGETPYQCQFCTKAFADKTSLKQHTRRYHTGEKPFTCMICDKMFYDSTNYKKHMKKEHYVVDSKDGDETR
nr:unnamed protein product [Callosobruchus chinensis]